MSTNYHYFILADLFRYPDGNFPNKLAYGLQLIEEKYPDAAESLNVFIRYTQGRSLREWEELYTKTFDVQAICYLDLGYVMFGEDYKRGVFLHRMKLEQEKAGNNCGYELPDNLSNMLSFFHKAKDEQIVIDLAARILIPGVEKMIAEFDQSRIDMKTEALKTLHKALIQEELNQGNVYRHLFLALQHVLQADFGQYVVNEEEQLKVIDPAYHHSFLQKEDEDAELERLIANLNLD